MARTSTRAKGTSVAKAKPTAVQTADFQAEMDEFRSRVQAPTGNKIKLDNKSFVLPNGDSSDILSGIIVDFVYYNSYYTTAYDPNNIVPPDCFSIALSPSEAVPSENSPDVQCDRCQACPQNQFGSAGKGKACRNSVLIAILPPDADEDTPIMTLNVSPTALKAFGGYVSSILRMNRPPYSVVTDFTFDASLKYDSVRFSNPEPVDEETFEIIKARREEAREILTTEPDIEAMLASNNAAAPKARPKAARGGRRRAA